MGRAPEEMQAAHRWRKAATELRSGATSKSKTDDPLSDEGDLGKGGDAKKNRRGPRGKAKDAATS